MTHGRRPRPWHALAALLTLGVAAVFALPRAVAQRPIWRPAQLGGVLTPRVTPQGAWAEVVSSTNKWLVLQDDEGRQFPVPISPATVGLFVVRWPLTPDRISPNAVAEVTGIDLGTNSVQATHVDVFEADALDLLGGGWPSLTHIGGFNRVLTPYAADPNNAYNGYDLIYPLPGENLIPNRLHVVAPVAGVAPLRLAVGNNNAIAVLPAPAGLSLTRVTDGTAAFISPGDIAYYLPTQATPKGLNLSQLVIYKRIPFDQFAR